MDSSYLKSILEYNPDTGDWTWLVDRGRTAKIGYQAGSMDKKGYCVIEIDGKAYKASRLAWLYTTGEWPERDVDHKDVNSSNDKWNNLRPATRSQNTCNRNLYRNNKSGVKGVYKRKKKYEVSIGVNSKRLYFGRYNTLEEAKAVRNEVAKELHGEFFHE